MRAIIYSVFEDNEVLSYIYDPPHPFPNILSQEGYRIDLIMKISFFLSLFPPGIFLKTVAQNIDDWLIR